MRLRRQQLDALGECGGACVADGDSDGICDDVDDCVGELDEVASATVLALSMSADVLTSQKDCDCDGNQLDALVNVEGRVADEDADGICDDVDDCVGELEECGICNGPRAIYDADVLTSQKAIATATETSSTPWACV